MVEHDMNRCFQIKREIERQKNGQRARPTIRTIPTYCMCTEIQHLNNVSLKLTTTETV